MFKHLSERPEYDGATARLATIFFQTKKGVTTHRLTQQTICKPADSAPKRSRKAEAVGRATKNARHDDLVMSAMKLAADKDRQLDRLQASVDEMVKVSAQQAQTQTQHADTQAKLIEHNHLLSQQDVALATSKNSLQAAPTNHGSLESAMETIRTFTAFQKLQSGSAAGTS